MIDASVTRRIRRIAAAATLALLVITATSLAALASGVLPGAIPQTSTFQDAGISNTAGLVFDGTHFWSVSGAGTTGNRLIEYDASGNVTGLFAPGLDFRSIFRNASGRVFARQFSDPKIYSMGATPSTFTAVTTLIGGALDAQAQVVLNGAGDRYIAHKGNTVTSWDLTGALIGTTTLVGWGTVGTENTYPSDRNIAAYGLNWLTWESGSKTLSVWDPVAGTRIGQGVLTGAGGSFSSGFSFSYTRGAAWVVDNFGQTWRGYALKSSSTSFSCSPNPVAVNSSTTCTATVTDTGLTSATPPTGSVAFTAPAGTFSGSPCTLSPTSATSSSCTASYTSTAAGTNTVTASYGGSSLHPPSSGTVAVTVLTTVATTPSLPAAGAGRGTTADAWDAPSAWVLLMSLAGLSVAARAFFTGRASSKA